MFVAKSVSRYVGRSSVIIGNRTVFLVQFGINLHLRVLKRSEIARAASVNNINMKECAWRKGQKIFLMLFFHYGKHFWKFPHKIFVIILHDIIALEKFILSFSQSYFRTTMCLWTGVTLFALVLLHLNCTALSQSEWSNFFMYIISLLNVLLFI